MARKKNNSIKQKKAAREKELDATFAEITRIIDSYMAVAPMVFLDGAGAAPGEYLFKEEPSHFAIFHGWNERWLGALYPRTIDMQKKIEDGKSGGDEYIDLCFDVQRFAFILGYLVGCRSMGARREELLTRAEAFKVNDIGWREWRAESEADEQRA